MSVSPAAGERVLIADDNRINRRLLGGMLSHHGLQVHEVDNGEVALSTALADPPELVLVDVDVPVIDGLEVCERLKSNAGTADVPVILLCELDDSERRLRGLEQGAADFVRKPLDRADVLARVGNQLRQRRVVRTLGEALGTIESQRASLSEAVRLTVEARRSLLPRSWQVERGALRWAWHEQVGERVSGDLFGVLPLAGAHTALFVLDVAGRDLAAGLLGISIAQRMAERWRELAAVGELLGPSAMLRRIAFEYPPERLGRRLTVACLLLDESTGRLLSSRAGHPPVLRVDAAAAVERLDEGGPPLGTDIEAAFEEREIQLEAGDRLVLYTDGVSEAPDLDGVPWGLEGLETFARATRGVGVESAASALDQMLAGRGERPAGHDDATFVLLDWSP